MDERRFDNIARRLGGIQSRRGALKTAGVGTVAAVFAALKPQNSALAQFVPASCQVRGGTCDRKNECCGAKRGSKEIVCKFITGLSGTRCCGQARARCTETEDCCETFECNATTLRCQHIG